MLNWLYAQSERGQGMGVRVISAGMDWSRVDALNEQQMTAIFLATRAHHHLTQAQCAEVIGRDLRFFQDLESGVKTPSPETYMRCVWLLEQEPVQEFRNQFPTHEVKRRIQKLATEVREEALV